MLFFISSAKKTFYLLPVRDARFPNKKMAVSLTSSCSCSDRCMSWVSPSQATPCRHPCAHPAQPHFSEGGWSPGPAPSATLCSRGALPSPAALCPHCRRLRGCGSGVLVTPQGEDLVFASEQLMEMCSQERGTWSPGSSRQGSCLFCILHKLG